MAEYAVTGYLHTGYNADNYPENAAQLAQFDTVAIDTVDLVQNVNLQTIRVTGSFDTLKAIDYIQVGDRYYRAYAAPSADADDVFTLTLQYDPITSNGGFSALEFSDGVTVRHTTADDDMFEYTESDPYTAPAQPLDVVSGGMKFTGSELAAIAVESTLLLDTIGGWFDDDGNFTGKGITYTDTADSSYKVTTPYTPGVNVKTSYLIGYNANTNVSEAETPSPATALYATFVVDGTSAVEKTKITRALGAVRSLAVEGSVLNQIAYPAQFITIPHEVGDGLILGVNGKDQYEDSGLDFDQYTDEIHNNRVKYGEYNKYGLMTAKGDKGEFLPEQIGEIGDTSPIVRSIADPRPDGRPYFRYQKYLGDTSFNGFWVSCLQGLEWQNVPLVYTSASGSYQTRATFLNNYLQQSSDKFYADQNQLYDDISRVVNAIPNAANTALGASAMQPTLAGINAIGAVGNLAMNATLNTAQSLTRSEQRQINYELSRKRALQEYAFSQNIVKPDLMFPFNANVIRDFIGNGVFAYRYKYKAADALRVDRLLTMYGYRDTRRLTTDMFSARQYFDYVQATGVAVSNLNIPLWERDAIADILNGGVRVWHTAVNTNRYQLGNPIKGAS